MNYPYEYGRCREMLKQLFDACTGENGEIPRNMPRSLFDGVRSYLSSHPRPSACPTDPACPHWIGKKGDCEGEEDCIESHQDRVVT